MKFKKLAILYWSMFFLSIKCNLIDLKQSSTVCLYSNNKTNKYYQNIKSAFIKFNIKFNEVDLIDKDLSNLYILFDILNIGIDELPKHYVVYQTQDLDTIELSNDYISKMLNAICVWDFKLENINKYKAKIHHYYYFPSEYEYADPIILVCFLPIEVLKNYKEIVSTSNINDSDVSSHLPTLFVYTVLQKPNDIIEAGVSWGVTTKIFYKSSQITHSRLIGIDCMQHCSSVYDNLNNAKFCCMDDLKFPEYYKKKLKGNKSDLIFIDTSHTYKQTMSEIKCFLDILAKNGIMLFHDSNVTPLKNNTMYFRINNTFGEAHGNTKGVTFALKNYFNINFKEDEYSNLHFKHNNIFWHMIHYPFCNGLTILKRID